MKILQALKKIKHIDRKIKKQADRVAKYCSVILEPGDAPPPYTEEDIRRMLQSITDLLTDKCLIRAALHRTNVNTAVEFQGQKKSIDELLLLQNVFLPIYKNVLASMRRKEKQGAYRNYSKEAKVVLHYSPAERDKHIEEIENVLEELNDILDNANIETDVIGLK